MQCNPWPPTTSLYQQISVSIPEIIEGEHSRECSHYTIRFCRKLQFCCARCWDNSQATIHPFAVYLSESGKAKCLSICVITDCLRHDTTMVHAFVSNVLAHLKKELPNITKVIYFSDGAASQYKNHKNVSNVCNHENDHGLKAEWHFFATSHGKIPCDGIGGTVKRLVARASLQATVDHHILTARKMFKLCEEHIMGITFLFVTSDDVQENSTRFCLEDHYSSAKTIPGIRSHHSFIPLAENELAMRRFLQMICSQRWLLLTFTLLPLLQ